MGNDKKAQVEALLQHYYSFILKKKPKQEEYDRTFLTLSYLFECNIDYLVVLNFLKTQTEMAITPEMLPDKFWNSSLIKRNAFYLHKELVLIAPPPLFNIKTMKFEEKPFYYEIKIKYYEDDVVDYFYRQLKPLSKVMAERKTDRKTVAFLMHKFSKIDFVEPLDIILCSIDIHMKKNPECYRLIEVADEALEVIKNLQADMQELESEDRRHITWRCME